MLVTISIVFLLVLEILLVFAFIFFIYKDWQRSKTTSEVDYKLESEYNLEENLETSLDHKNSEEK